MKAAQISEYGHADKIQVVDINKPTIKDDQVLVEVHAASLNPFDTTVREGHVKDMISSLPVTLGGDIAGVVREVGAGVTSARVGDKVYGQAAVVAGNSGALAEFAATKASQVATTPVNLDFTEAASLPLVGVSALQALTDHINLQPSQKLFIHGASGGIGSIAVQIAKSIGAYVAGSVRGSESIEFVKGLGVDEVIDTETQDFSELLKDYDAVFEAAGGADFDKTLEVLKRGGVAVSMLATADEAKAQELGITAITQGTKVTTEKLQALAKLVEDGAVKPQVTKSFPLSQVQEAFEARESGKVPGKIVVIIKQ
jgi:alcohol dehydrogenase